MKSIFTSFILFCAFSTHFQDALALQLDFVRNLKVAPASLEPEGRVRETALAAMLAQAFKEKKLGKDFSASSCMTAKALSAAGSFNTIQLFAVQSTCTSRTPASYIVKEAREGIREATALREIELFPGMSDLMPPKKPPAGNLNVALPIAYLSYQDSYRDTHYLAIMPSAKGSVLCDVIKDLRKNAQTFKEKIGVVYANLGTQLANFHQKIKRPSSIYKVITDGAWHGDLHCLNAYYDMNDNLATLIDNETIAATLKNPGSPEDDILKLFLAAFSKWEAKERKDYMDGMDLATWFNSAFSSFVDGYARAYPAPAYRQVLGDLRAMFNKEKMPSWLSIAPEQLKELREKYINPIIDGKLSSR
jgi:hypothetical protein